MKKKKCAGERKNNMTFYGSVGVIGGNYGIVNIPLSNRAQNGSQSNEVNKCSDLGTARIDSVLKEDNTGNENGCDTFKTEDEQSLFTKEVTDYVLQRLNGQRIKSVKQLSVGRSGSQVFLISCISHDSHVTGWRIVKLSKVNDTQARYADVENKACQDILIQSPKDFRQHLVDSKVFYHNNLQIILSELATRSYLHSKMLCELTTAQKAKYVKCISDDVLLKWNKNFQSNGEISSFFSTLLGTRIEANGEFTRRIKQLLEKPQAKIITGFLSSSRVCPNPHYYILNISELIRKIEPHLTTSFITGKTHGDFNAQNMICDSSSEDFNYVIIDYSHYNPQSFVLYDHAFLEADNYYHILKDKTEKVWKEQLTLLKVRINKIVKPAEGDNDNYYTELVSFRNAICTSISDWGNNQHEHNFDDIEIQFACARIAAGVKKFCSPSVKTYKERKLMLYYIARCMKNLFNLVLHDNTWLNVRSDEITSLLDDTLQNGTD